MVNLAPVKDAARRLHSPADPIRAILDRQPEELPAMRAIAVLEVVVGLLVASNVSRNG